MRRRRAQRRGRWARAKSRATHSFAGSRARAETLFRELEERFRERPALLEAGAQVHVARDRERRVGAYGGADRRTRKRDELLLERALAVGQGRGIPEEPQRLFGQMPEEV